MRKVAVVITGCGHQDGSELTETISSLIALSEFGAHYDIYSPDHQFKVRNHLLREETSEVRNTLIESGRISRGQSKKLSDLSEKNYDALLIPGGTGVGRSLCTWVEDKMNMQVDPHLEKIILNFHSASKPIGLICIAPVLAAKVLKKYRPTLTLGPSKDLEKLMTTHGIIYEHCPVNDYITDRETKVISTPAYMFENASAYDVYQGIRGLVKELVEMA